MAILCDHADWAVPAAQGIVQAWWNLFEYLITKYNNGARVRSTVSRDCSACVAQIDNWHSDRIEPTATFYPFNWLKQVGYWPADMDFERASLALLYSLQNSNVC